MENIGNIILGILIPFAGTTLGAACVYFMRNGIRQNVEKGLLGFASGVMVAASVWSLLIPSMNLSADLVSACGDRILLRHPVPAVP